MVRCGDEPGDREEPGEVEPLRAAALEDMATSPEVEAKSLKPQ